MHESMKSSMPFSISCLGLYNKKKSVMSSSINNLCLKKLKCNKFFVTHTYLRRGKILVKWPYLLSKVPISAQPCWVSTFLEVVHCLLNKDIRSLYPTFQSSTQASSTTKISFKMPMPFVLCSLSYHIILLMGWWRFKQNKGCVVCM